MTADIYYFEEARQLVAKAFCKDICSNDAIEDTFKHLDEALDAIEKRLDESDIYFFIIKIDAEGTPVSRSELDPFVKLDGFGKSEVSGEPLNNNDSLNPWEVFCPPFWTKASAVPHLRARVKGWLGRLEKTLILAESYNLSTESLWEDDVTQFGEPLATHMALLDIEFVPYYTRLLRLWDMGHEVDTGGYAAAIVEKYGITPEMKELMTCYLEGGPYEDQGFPELLEEAKSE